MIAQIITKTADSKIKWTIENTLAWAIKQGTVYELTKKTLRVEGKRIKATEEEIADLRTAVSLQVLRRFGL